MIASVEYTNQSKHSESCKSLNIESHVDLKLLNTFAVSARASRFLTLENHEAIIKALPIIQTSSKRLILGGGSNLLFISDFDGLVIFPQIFGIQVISHDEENVLLSVGASENWHEFVVSSVKNGWFGLENLALIPGTVGASPVQNIGAYGVEVKQFIECVECIDLQTGESLIFKNEDCQFAYRDSFFKQADFGRYLITHVQFRLSKTPQLNLTYKPLADFFKDKLDVTPMDVVQEVCKIRSQKLPDPKTLANAGSFFKNPVVSLSQYETLQQSFPDIVAYPVDNDYKLAAGWLIDHAGLKGYRDDDVGVHEHQALVLVNYSATSGKRILALAKKIQEIIAEKYQVKLEAEVRVIGDGQ